MKYVVKNIVKSCIFTLNKNNRIVIKNGSVRTNK